MRHTDSRGKNAVTRIVCDTVKSVDKLNALALDGDTKSTEGMMEPLRGFFVRFERFEYGIAKLTVRWNCICDQIRFCALKINALYV